MNRFIGGSARFFGRQLLSENLNFKEFNTKNVSLIQIYPVSGQASKPSSATRNTQPSRRSAGYIPDFPDRHRAHHSAHPTTIEMDAQTVCHKELFEIIFSPIKS
jgi:hypothetical protein